MPLIGVFSISAMRGVLSGAKSGDLSGGGRKGKRGVWNGFSGIVMFWWGRRFLALEALPAIGNKYLPIDFL